MHDHAANVTEFRPPTRSRAQHLWQHALRPTLVARRLAGVLFDDEPDLNAVTVGELDLAIDLFRTVAEGPPATEAEIRLLAVAAASLVGAKYEAGFRSVIDRIAPPWPSVSALAIGMRDAARKSYVRCEYLAHMTDAIDFALDAEERFAGYIRRAENLRSRLDALGHPERPTVRRPTLRLVVDPADLPRGGRKPREPEPMPPDRTKWPSDNLTRSTPL